MPRSSDRSGRNKDHDNTGKNGEPGGDGRPGAPADEEPKSAYELAMERLRRQDREEGREAPAPLTDGQKEEIARVRSEMDAKIAHLEIMHKTHLMKTGGDPEAIERVEEDYRFDRRKIDEERKTRIERVRRAPKK